MLGNLVKKVGVIIQLFILDKSAEKSAQILFDAMGSKYCFKLAIEGFQLICSAGFSDIYKKIPQGKIFQNWLKDYLPARDWFYENVSHLLLLSSYEINISEETEIKTDKILQDFSDNLPFETENLVYAPFRYAKEYKCNIPTDTLLPIEDCIAEYKKYLEWKVG